MHLPLLLVVLAQAPGQPVAPQAASLLPAREAPLTVAEASGFRRSSRLDEVLAFCTALEALPHGDRIRARTIGRTSEGRPLVALTASLPGGSTDRAQVVVNANIHGGEIEGKVACQLLLRDIAMGRHAELLAELDVTFVPVYNADGNDRISRSERVTQNGPDGGVGQRPNAMGLDLNRDFVKCEAPETRALLGLVNELKPIAFMDLHTTNGSAHGYDLTYAPSLSPNAREDVLTETKDILVEVQRVLEEDSGVYTFDYGNFRYARRAPGSRGERGDPIGWNTYDARPRFGTNLMGLRGVVSILSEAYSYLPYRRRVEVTYTFTLECLRAIASRRVELERLVHGPDRVEEFGLDPELGPIERLLVRVGEIDSVVIDIDPLEPGVQEGRRRVASPRPEAREVEMEVARGFQAKSRDQIGAAWAIAKPSERVLELLELHLGQPPERLADPLVVEADVFEVDELVREQRLFQGHRAVDVGGSFARRQVELPSGAVVVPASRVVAQLLHPRSDDSLTTWNFFDAELRATENLGDGEVRMHPCVRLIQLPDRSSRR